MGVSAKKRKGMKAAIIMATLYTLPALSHWEVECGVEERGRRVYKEAVRS